MQINIDKNRNSNRIGINANNAQEDCVKFKIFTAVAMFFCVLPVAAQNWLKGYKPGEKTVTVPYTAADLEYGKTPKLRIDGDRDKVTAEKMNKQIFGPARSASRGGWKTRTCGRILSGFCRETRFTMRDCWQT
jgi:hypothetical protein